MQDWEPLFSRKLGQELRVGYRALLGQDDEAIGVIGRKTGARGLPSILESILLETMFDLPGLEGVEEVVISRELVGGTARPLYIYADRSDRAVENSAMAY